MCGRVFLKLVWRSSTWRSACRKAQMLMGDVNVSNTLNIVEHRRMVVSDVLTLCVCVRYLRARCYTEIKYLCPPIKLLNRTTWLSQRYYTFDLKFLAYCRTLQHSYRNSWFFSVSHCSWCTFMSEVLLSSLLLSLPLIIPNHHCAHTYKGHLLSRWPNWKEKKKTFI